MMCKKVTEVKQIAYYVLSTFFHVRAKNRRLLSCEKGIQVVQKVAEFRECEKWRVFDENYLMYATTFFLAKGQLTLIGKKYTTRKEDWKISDFLSKK